MFTSVSGGGVTPNIHSTSIFKGGGENVSRGIAPLKHDSVEFSAENKIKETKKDELSTSTKWVLGLGATALVGIGARFGYQNLVKNIYKKNIKLSNLPENIIFKKANSKEDALKFTKETLKIDKIDDCFSLEELNYINKALVNVSNRHKGKCVMPAGIIEMDKDVVDMAKGTIAGINYSVQSKDFANLAINRSYFKPENLDTKLKEYYYKNNQPRIKPNTIYKYNNEIYGKPGSELSKLLEKYYQSPSTLKLEDKLKLIESYNNFQNNLHNLQQGIKTGSNDIKSNRAILMGLKSENHSIYHELGHLQDLLQNNMKQHISSPFMYEIDMRRNMLNILPTKSHKEFANNKAIQETAGKISEYAKTSRDEFIAETYAKIIAGEKIPEDVMILYRKYNGPFN